MKPAMTPDTRPLSKMPLTLRVPRDGYALHAVAQAPGDPGAPLLVFSNSLLTDLSLWDAQAAALTGAYGVLRYDQAGHGQSQQPAGPVDFDTLGADLLAVMEAAGVHKAVCVGLSRGVPTALAAYRLAPARFTALVLCDGQACTGPGGAAAWAERIGGARASGMRAWAEATAGRWLTATVDAATRQRLTAMIGATPFAGFALCATALMRYDYTDVPGRISCPTLLIAGAEDGALPVTMATTLCPAIAGAQMHVIPQAGHVPCLEQPAAFTEALRGFLSTLPAPRR